MFDVIKWLNGCDIFLITNKRDLLMVKLVQYAKRLLNREVFVIAYDQIDRVTINFINLCVNKKVIVNGLSGLDKKLLDTLCKIDRHCIFLVHELYAVNNLKILEKHFFFVVLPKFSGFDHINDRLEFDKKQEHILIDLVVEEVIKNIDNPQNINFDHLDNFSQLILIRQQKCSLRLLYQGRPNDVILGRNVGEFRINLGKRLLDYIDASILNNIDYIVPIPSSGIFYAVGLSIASSIPVLPIVNKLNISERAFEIQSVDSRRRSLYDNIQINSHLIKNKNILLVDEAIFTGATLKVFCDMLKGTEVADIHIAIPSPKCYNQCSYLVQPRRQLLLDKISDDHLAYYFGVKSVSFIDLKDYNDELKDIDEVCIECFEYRDIRRDKYV